MNNQKAAGRGCASGMISKEYEAAFQRIVQKWLFRLKYAMALIHTDCDGLPPYPLYKISLKEEYIYSRWYFSGAPSLVLFG
jgi:hypothetical protein